jgi:hypothetical protein
MTGNAVADRGRRALPALRDEFAMRPASKLQRALGERAEPEARAAWTSMSLFLLASSTHFRLSGSVAYCRLEPKSSFSRASAISVMAMSVSARVLRSGASSSACFSASAVGRHHRQRVHQHGIVGAADALPVGFEVVGLEVSARKALSSAGRSTSRAGLGPRRGPPHEGGDAALPERRLDRQLLEDPVAADTPCSEIR